MTKEQAVAIAKEYLGSTQLAKTEELVLLEDQTIETKVGWIFFWNSRLYVQTGDFRYALAGNGPIIVDRANGAVTEASSVLSVEQLVERLS